MAAEPLFERAPRAQLTINNEQWVADFVNLVQNRRLRRDYPNC